VCMRRLQASTLAPVTSVGAVTVGASSECCRVVGSERKSIFRFIALWSYARLRLMPRAKVPRPASIVVAMCITLLR